MRALQCHGEGRVSIVQAPNPRPEAGEVLVRIEASAVCGSERQALVDGMASMPGFLNLGHEASGVIVDGG
jgi:(R,R)-butanediol dehydrogenase/meso-butanediol dehydrogenase/diacetyl reductase